MLSPSDDPWQIFFSEKFVVLLLSIFTFKLLKQFVQFYNSMSVVKTKFWLDQVRLQICATTIQLQSVSWILAEFYFNRGLQRLYTGTCIILQKTINGFLCLLIVFLKSKTYQLILKDVIKSNRNLR